MTSIFSKAKSGLVTGLLLIVHCTIGQTVLDTEKLVSNLDFPWEIYWGSDDHLWLTQTTGAIIKYDPKYNTFKTLTVLPAAIDETHGNPAAIGLFGLALHPDFPEVPWVYVMYNYDFIAPSTVTTRISRLEYNAKTDTLENEVVFIDDYAGYDKHSGGRMIITQDQKLLVTTGDEFKRSYAQRMDQLNGKTLRFNLDGSVPSDNPFTALDTPFDYIYTFGHRNPQGLIQTTSGNIFSSEHGPNSDDEVNLIQSGNNYGWPFVKGFCDDNYPGNWNDNIAEGGESELAPYFGTNNHLADVYPYGYEDESDYCENFNITEPAHSFLNERVAPSGLDFYNSDTIPEWKNSLMLATLREKDIRLMKLNNSQDEITSVETIFNETFDRVRDLAITPYGDVYVISSEREDNNINSLYRIGKKRDAALGVSELSLAFQSADSSFALNWNAAADYLSYFIIEREVGDEILILDTLNYNERSYTDSNATFGQPYTYSLKMMRNGGELNSAEESFQTIEYPVDLTLPETISLSWDDTHQGILLEWSASVDTFTTFNIRRTDALNTFEVYTLTSETTSYLDSTVTFGEPYGYVLRSFRDGKELSKSDSVVFQTSDYPILVEPLAITPAHIYDLFSSESQADIKTLDIVIYDLSGKKIIAFKNMSWDEWVHIRRNQIPKETLFLWKAEFFIQSNTTNHLEGKAFIQK
ncbi:MAG: PQQ-dependent sugar dehydrogenase [Cyclobacteriaceae bacterium]